MFCAANTAMPLSSCSSARLPPPLPPPPPYRNGPQQPRDSLKTIKHLVESTICASPPSLPVDSLRRGNWVKLICGASFEDVVDVRNLSLVYTLAGVDCIDCAADDAVVNAVNEGIEAAGLIAPVRRPWVMISVNDDREDLHFRKAEFDPDDCPPDCLRPCERVCPADAISLKVVGAGGNAPFENGSRSKLQGGVKTERCYGCGRCFTICPYDKIRALTYVRDASATCCLLKRDDVDAIEIHTSGRQHDLFKDLWTSLENSIQYVQLVAVSLPDMGDSTSSTMNEMFSIMKQNLQCHNLWQLDGRPMSGDIGRGATKDVIAFAMRLAFSEERPTGFLQLAGGTNSHTIECLKREGLFQTLAISNSGSSGSTTKASLLDRNSAAQALVGGVAYGGYARKIVGRILWKLNSEHGHLHIEDHPEYLLQALREALSLVGPVKCYQVAPL